MRPRHLRRQRGLSLVEVAIASVILGACGVMLWGVIDRQAKVSRTDRSSTLIDRANDAMLAYGYLHGRLPCPAPVTTGMESCDGKDSGFLPYLTLGLPDPAAGRVRYRVSMVAPSPVTGGPYQVVVTQQSGPEKNLYARVVPLSGMSPGAHEPLLDLCQSLGASVHAGKMAYGLALDPAGAAAPAPIGTAGSSTPVTAEAVQHTMSRAQFAARLNCSYLAAAGRAQFNVAMAADSMARAMDDILEQFKLVKFTYAGDTAQGVYWELNSIYSLDRAITKTMAAQAALLASNGVNSAPRNLAAVKMLLAGTYTAALTSNLARFVTFQVKAESREDELRDLLEVTEKTAADVKARALLGTSSAFFLEDKWLAPAP